jgi:hypothetical protein
MNNEKLRMTIQATPLEHSPTVNKKHTILLD